MTTVEKLFVQIFERKNSIIQQVKRQTDLYSQHLAAKLLVDGITPPPWLWNPSQSSDVQKELNKEELISEILLPHPHPTFGFSSAHSSVYNKLAVAGDNGELLDGLFNDAYAHNKDLDTRDKQPIEAGCHDTHPKRTSFAPELHVSVASPQDETEVRISSTYTAPDQSLARIHRSKSRQKALELRNSAKGEPKSRSSQQNDPVVSSAINILSIFDSEPVDQVIVQKNKCAPVQYKQEFLQCPDSDNGSLEVNTSHVAAESCMVSEARAEDCRGHKEKGTNICGGRISESSSSQQLCCPNNAQEVGKSIHSSKAKGGVPSQSTGKSVHQFSDANNHLELIKAPEGLSSGRTRLKSSAQNEGIVITSSFSGCRDTRSNFGATQENPITTYEVHNKSDGDVILPCPDFQNNTDQTRNFGNINLNELMSHDLVKDQPVNSRSIVHDAGLECLVAKPSSGSLMSMEPKQLDFADPDEQNLNKNFRPSLENGKLETSPEQVFCSSSDNRITPDKFNNVTSVKLSSVQPEISTNVQEFYRGSLESNIEQHVEVQMKKYGSGKDDCCILNTIPDNSEAVGNVPNSKFTCHAEIEQSNAFGNLKAEKCISLYFKEVSETLPELQIEEGQCRTEGNEKSKCASHSSESKHFGTPHLTSSVEKAIETSKDCLIEEGEALDPTYSVVDVNGQCCVQEKQNLSCLRGKFCCAHADNVSSSQQVFERSYSLEENGLVTCGSVKSPLDSKKDLDLSRSRELQVAKKSRSIKGDSWPRSKRRKIEDQETDSFSASPSFRIQKLYCGQMDPKSRNLKQVGDVVKSVLGFASPAKKSIDAEIYQKMARQLNEVTESSPELQHLEGGLHSEEQSKHAETSSSSDVGKLNDQQDNMHLLQFENDDNLVNPEGLTCVKRTILEGKSYLGVDDRLTHGLAQSPSERALELIGAEQSMPVFEGFIIDSHITNEEVDIPGMNFNKLDLPRTSRQHASILEQICKSTSMETPLTEFSSAFKLHESQKCYQSVPTGLLEYMDLRRISALNEHVDKQLRSNSMDYVTGSFQGMFPDCPPYSGAPFCWDLGKPYTSPVGKLWERMSFHTGSSGKQLSSNPELTCFPIEEDPTISEENENVCEAPGKTQEEIDLLFNTCSKREPLADITGTCLNAPSSISAAEKFVGKVSAHCMGKEISFSETHDMVKGQAGNHCRNKSKENENALLSMGANGKKSEESLNNRSSKVNSSCKTSSRRVRNKLSEKVPKHNNIVSNVTSFIPLVQQKKAAVVCTGKRDIKVKALEAAEAAKRLEEKKENERKMRKEALKLERARMEQENLRQMELNKKRKEEERKKKAADIVAKKRQRDEEEKKEKATKRKRVEERQQKREQGKQLSVIDERDNKEEANHRSNKSQDLGKESSDNIYLEKLETPRPNGSTRDIQQAGISLGGCGTSSDSCDQRKAISALDTQIDNLILGKTQEKSYEISPYQCSDDEEEEEEDIPNRKFIPSWASKNCVALVLPLQQGIEPDVIFPPESFCSTDEVQFSFLESHTTSWQLEQNNHLLHHVQHMGTLNFNSIWVDLVPEARLNFLADFLLERPEECLWTEEVRCAEVKEILLEKAIPPF